MRIRVLVAIPLLVATWVVPPGRAGAAPSLRFVSVPFLGSTADLRGRVDDIDPSAFRVAVYVLVDGGWWSKPFFDAPLTAIAPDGRWTCDITTGGRDTAATEIDAFLVPEGFNVPLLAGEDTLPPDLDDGAVAHAVAYRGRCAGPEAMASTRALVAETCECDGAPSHQAYVACAAGVAKAAVRAGMLPRNCRNHVLQCARTSTCGRPSSVTCCRTSARGLTGCSIKSSAGACRAPKNGRACTGTLSSCCDACATACVFPPASTTTTSLPTPPSTTSTTSTSIQRTSTSTLGSTSTSMTSRNTSTSSSSTSSTSMTVSTVSAPTSSSTVTTSTSTTSTSVPVCPGGVVGDPAAAPSITITQADPSRIRGVATNLNGQTVQAVCYATTNRHYIQPDIFAWGTSVCSDGSWETATYPWGSITCLLVDTATFAHPSVVDSDPCELDGVLACDVYPATRIITWSGYTWIVRDTHGYLQDPGPNYYSGSEANVGVDANGDLHLACVADGTRWTCPELTLTEPHGHGVYTYQLGSRVDDQPAPIVFSGFLYESIVPWREIDIEFSPSLVRKTCTALGHDCPDATAQSVVHPYTHTGNLVPFVMPAGAESTHRIAWASDRVDFASWEGIGPLPDPEDLTIVHARTYTGPDIPPSVGGERFHFIQWLESGAPPGDGKAHEVVVHAFHYEPLATVSSTSTTLTTSTSTTTTIPGGPGAPVVTFTHVPPLGSFENLTGVVLHVAPASYELAIYIQVRGGWWTKPYFVSPLTPINSDGSWGCDITTGGVDEEATSVVAYLVPATYSPPLMSGGAPLPTELDQNAVFRAEAMRGP